MESFVRSGTLGRYGERLWEYPDFECFEFYPRKTRYCLMVFVINENGRLQAELRKLRPLLEQVDVLVADGGSTDGSTALDVLSGFGIRGLLVKKGPGRLGAQMRMAFAYALSQGYEGIICVDGNDKDDVAASLDTFVHLLDAGFDHVQGSRYVPGGHHENTPLSRHIGVKLIHAPLLSLASGFAYTDTTNGFRAYSRRFLESEQVALFRDEYSGYELHYKLAIDAAQLGYRVCETPTTRKYPNRGPTPTKISGIRGNFRILTTLVSTCFKQSKRLRGQLWLKAD